MFKATKLCSFLVLPVLILSFTSTRVPAEPAPLIGFTPHYAATGSRSEWDFGATDITFKAQKNEVWVLDAYSDTVPRINRFKLASLASPPISIPLSLPAEVQGAIALGIAELPQGTFAGKNLVLVDKTFGQEAAQEAYFLIFDDDGNAVPEFAPQRVTSLPATAKISSIDVNPEREEIAAYDLAGDLVYLLDFTFSQVVNPFPLLGRRNLLVGPWYFGDTLLGSGTGLAYGDPDLVLAGSAFFNATDARFVLEYKATDSGTYAGQAMDLSATATAEPIASDADFAFAAIDTGKFNDQDVLFAVNLATDALYVLGLQLDPQPAPPTLASCNWDSVSSTYRVEWTPDPGLPVDGYRIFVGGVQVAVLPDIETSYESPVSFVGKTLIEVAAEKDGVVSDLRVVCELENTAQPPLDGVTFIAVGVNPSVGILDVAVPKTPASLADFRVYALQEASNAVFVFDHTLDPDTMTEIQLQPQVTTKQGNVAASGLALTELDGKPVLAVLDPDGTAGAGPPRATFHSLESASLGSLVKAVDAIDLAALSPVPRLLDWDANSKGNFVAGAQSGIQFYIVSLEFDGTSIRGTQMVPIPHRLLTPFVDTFLSGIGVAVLPSDNLLVAGSDTFSKTYTEALLVTPMTAEQETSARIVGYAQGLIVTGAFFGDEDGSWGPGIGPVFANGLAAAYFPPGEGQEAGVGVTYLSTPEIVILRDVQWWLILSGQILVHSTNDCSHPELLAEQLAEVTKDIPQGSSDTSGALSPTFAGESGPIDYFYYVINESTTESATLGLTVALKGEPVEKAGVTITLPPGRYYRGSLVDRTETSIEVSADNTGSAAASVKFIVGATAIASPGEPVFRRGDCAADDGTVQINDAIFGLNFLFLGGTEPACQDACDTDDDGQFLLTDMVRILNYLFQGGDPPLPPGPETCGSDPTDIDSLLKCMYPKPLCQ